MPTKAAQSGVGGDELLRLTGNQIKLVHRPEDTSSRASSRCALLGGGILRPFTTVPLLNLDYDEFDFSKDDSARPMSADVPYTGYLTESSGGRSVTSSSADLQGLSSVQLRSSKLLKSLLAEPLHSWRNGTRYAPKVQQQKAVPRINLSSNKRTLPEASSETAVASQRSLLSDDNKRDSDSEQLEKCDRTRVLKESKENTAKQNAGIVENIDTKALLIPGLKTKPPLPTTARGASRSPSTRCEVSKKENKQSNGLERTLTSLENCDFLRPVHITVREDIGNVNDCEDLVSTSSTITSTVESLDLKLQSWVDEERAASEEVAKKELKTDRSLQSLKLQNEEINLDEYKPPAKRTKNFVQENIKLISARRKLTLTQNSSDEHKVKGFTPSQIRAPPDARISDAPEVESWMSAEVVEATTVKRSEKGDSKQQVPYSDVLDVIEELEKEEDFRGKSPAKLRDVGFAAASGESTYDEITALLKVLEEEDKKAHENMESIKELVNGELCEMLNDTRSGDASASEIAAPAAASGLMRPASAGVAAAPLETHRRIDALDFFCIREGGESETTDDKRPKPPPSPNLNSSNLNDIFTFLDEVDKNCAKSIVNAKQRVQCATQLTDSILPLDTIPRFEDLANRPPPELIHQIIDLNLRIKEKSSAIATLQGELSTLRKQITRMNKEMSDTIKDKLKSQKDEHEVVVRRHQKFIDQLIADKKNLNQQCESLLHEMKVIEDRFNSNLKALEHRHKVEMQKARDMHAAAERVRKERWIDDKTKRIKELTIKGLEPEMDKMAARHQQEISDIRAFHKRELEELEMRNARKMQQQSESLREQFTEEREKALVHERDTLRVRYEKMVESEEHNYQEQRRKLVLEHANRMADCERRESDALAERDRAIKMAQSEFEDKFQAAVRRHNNELDLLKEKTELEMEAFRNNHKKQSGMQLAEKEAQIRERCKRERDREIEAVIERLEADSEETKTQLEQSAENRIKRLKEKYEAEIRDMEQLVKDSATKYSDFKNKLLQAEDVVINLQISVKQLESQLSEAKQKVSKLTDERSQMKEILQEETKHEVHALKRQLQELKSDKEKELQQVYSRVKLAVARKDESIVELTRENTSLQEKCAYLENMLEQQRKEYLIKQ